MHVEAVRGDITRQQVDVIVNAANGSLLGGGGVDGAIHRSAGPSLLSECRRIRLTTHPDGLPDGDAVATGAGNLPSRWVVHTVGPRRWEHEDGGAALLASCHRRSLEVADGLGATGIAFPAISCGAFGWTAQEAAPIAIAAVRTFAAGHPSSSVALVRFVLFDPDSHAAFAAACSVLQ